MARASSVLALLLALGITSAQAGAAVISMDVDPPGCAGFVAGTGTCEVAPGTTLAVTWSLTAPELLNGYQLEIRWDPTELTLLGSTQLFPDSGTPVPFTQQPGDPSDSRASAFSFDPQSTLGLFRVTFQASPAGGDGQPDVWWFPVGAGLSPAGVVLENPAGAAIDLTPTALGVPALGLLGGLALALGMLLGGLALARAARRAGGRAAPLP